MRKFCFVTMFLLFALPAWGTTYYVDSSCTDTNPASATVDGSNYDPATPSCTGGSDKYYVTVADINAAAATLAPGDTVSFRKGQTWREQLTIPESGTSGNVYTFNSFGTGDAPILSGADVLTSWTEAPGTPTAAESQNAGTTDWNRNYDGAYYMAQGWESDTSITVPYIDVWLKKTGSPTGNCSIEIWNTSGSPARYDSVQDTSDSLDVSTLTTSYAQKRFTFSPSVSITADAIKIYALSCDFAVNGSNYVSMALETGDNYRGSDPYRIQLYELPDVTYSGGADHDFRFIIYKDTAGGSVYYKESITTEPNQVFYDGTKLTANDGATTGVGSNEWDWAADTLYVNVGEDPSTGTLEAAQRDYVVVVGDRDYITVDGLKTTQANETNITLYAGSPNNVTIQNCDISYAADYGLGISLATATSILIDDNDIHHNEQSGIFLYKHDAGASTQNTISNNNIYNNATSGSEMGIYVIANNYIIEGNVIEVFNPDDDGYGENITIRYNIAYNNISGSNDGTAFAADDLSSYVDIYYNIAYNNDGPCVGSWRSNNINIYNNTCYDNMQDSDTSHTSGGEISVGGNAEELSNIVVKNNIGQATGATWPAIRCDSYCEGSSGLDIDANIWYAAATNWYYWNSGGGNNLATWNALTGVGTDYNEDPLMNAPASQDFTLTSSSPAIDQGTDVGLTTDYAGNTVYVGTAPDIGAYEWQYGAPVLVTPPDSTTGVLTGTTSVKFTWKSVANLVQYELQVDDNSDFSSPEIDVYLTTNSYEAWNLLEGKTYYWRVRAQTWQ